MSMIEDQKEFMQLGGQTVATFNAEQDDLYVGLIEEEFEEFIEAVSKFDTCRELSLKPELLAKAVKENVDIIVTCMGWLLSIGIEPEAAWNLVHENNLKKVTNSDAISYDKNGKIKKSTESIARKAEMTEGLIKLIIAAKG